MKVAVLALVAGALFARTGPATAQTARDEPAATSTGAGIAETTFPGAASAPIEGRVDPDTYRVGPGDEFALRYSDLMDPRLVRVNPSGELLLPDAGAVPVAGLTLREAESKIREALRGYVRGKGLAFTLYRPRRFRIPVLGDVGRPGAVTLAAPVRASEAIAEAGGVLPTGASRGIEVRRGRDTLRVDLVRYARLGDLAPNPLVFETDVVFVPAAGLHIAIYGAVAHGGRYDFVPGDRVSGLVALAGGAMPDAALEEAEIERPDIGGKSSERVRVNLRAALASPGGSEDPVLKDGDRLLVPALAHYKEGAIVQIDGEVKRPGPYTIRDGVDGIRSLIERAGGLTEYADVARARIDRGREAAERDTSFLHLAREHADFLTHAEREYVKIRSGQRTALAADLAPVLESSGGGDLSLMNGDYIVIPRRLLTVSVQGEVRSPGHVPFEPGRGAADYVQLAGGFTDRADFEKVRVSLARTDHQVSASDAGALRAGDTVWVPAKRDRNNWGVVRDVIIVAGQVATIYLVIREATR